MSRYSCVENPPVHLWNSFLEKFPEGNFEQCFEYGEVIKAAFPKSRVARLAVERDGKLVGTVLGNYSGYFGFGMTLEVMRGPLVKTEKNVREDLEVAKGILKVLEGYSKKNRIIKEKALVPDSWPIQRAFQDLGYSVMDRQSEYVVSLEKGVNELWKNISRNKRKNIKKATDKGVEIVQSHNYEDMLTFFLMLRAAEKRDGFLSHPRCYFEAIWNTYKPELVNVFLARWKGKNVSGAFTVIHGNTVYALAAGSFSEGWEVRPNDKMHWEIMSWASQRGYSKYHMGLVSDPPPVEGSHAWGIWRWKREWNGSLNKIKILEKLLLPRYKLVLKAKETVERAHEYIRRFR